MTTRSTRSLAAIAAVAAALLIGGCPDGADGGRQARNVTPSGNGSSTSPAPSARPGGLGGKLGGTEAEMTPTPRPTGLTGSGPTLPPTASPAVAAQAVFISPADTVLLALPPATGSSAPEAGFATTATLSAYVLMDDQSTASAVTWQSGAPEIVAVSGSGVVSAAGAGAGSGPWQVWVWAISADGAASASRLVEVAADGGLDVVVE